MQDVLVVIGPVGSPIRKTDLAAIGFAKSTAARGDGAFDVLLMGANASSQSPSVATMGARTVFVMDHADLRDYTAEAYARALAHFLVNHRYRLICAATSSSTREFFPRVAARLDVPMVSDILELAGIDAEAVSFRRAVFVGNLLASVLVRAPVVLATCRGSVFDPPVAEYAASSTEKIVTTGSLAHSRKRFIALHQPKSERPELTEAQIVVSAGRGTRGPDQGIPLVMALADRLGAAVGATRAVVDAGWLANEYQVGQTGKIVAPKLYIAVGLSGSIQHLAGMRNSKTIVAINKDPEAPIFDVADVGLVADLFDAVPAMTRAIGEIKEGS